jgi:hypothetical protein
VFLFASTKLQGMYWNPGNREYLKMNLESIRTELIELTHQDIDIILEIENAGQSEDERLLLEP